MAWRLNNVVVAGDLNNTRRNSVWGYLWLRELDRPVMVNLTGDCAGPLQGKRFHFEIRDRDAECENDFDYDSFAMEQIGPTGTCTVDEIGLDTCDLEKSAAPSDLSHLSSSVGKPRLYLEWYSQNGRVVLELIDPVLEIDDGQDMDSEVQAALNESLTPEEPAEFVSPQEEELDEDDSNDGDSQDLFDASYAESESPFIVEDPEEDDPYGLFPDEFQHQLDSEFERADNEIGLGKDTDDDIAGLGIDEDTMRLWEKWDEMFSGEKDVPIREIFDPPMKLVPEQHLDDEQIKLAFSTLLMRLAIHGIALDMCEHFTARDAYKLLVEEILPADAVYPELVATNYVFHYMTSEYCPKCDEECEARYQADDERRERDQLGGNDGNDDSIPF